MYYWAVRCEYHTGVILIVKFPDSLDGRQRAEEDAKNRRENRKEYKTVYPPKRLCFEDQPNPVTLTRGT